MKIFLHSRAADELRRIIEHYDEEQPGLGRDFVRQFDQVVELCRQHPNIGPIFAAPHRRLVLRRFPYNIIYRVDGDAIRIVAIAHQHREPSYWKDR
jgi:plasmid stabilization system protein ParE